METKIDKRAKMVSFTMDKNVIAGLTEKDKTRLLCIFMSLKGEEVKHFKVLQ